MDLCGNCKYAVSNWQCNGLITSQVLPYPPGQGITYVKGFHTGDAKAKCTVLPCALGTTPHTPHSAVHHAQSMELHGLHLLLLPSSFPFLYDNILVISFLILA